MIRFLCKNSAVSFERLKQERSGVRPDLPEQRVQPAPKDNGARLELCPPDIAAELAAVLAEEPDGRYTHYLTCRRILEAMNSAYRDSARTRRKYPVNWAYLNPEDMTDAGIEEGQEIRLTSEFGQITAIAKPERVLRRGVVSMTHMFGSLGVAVSPKEHGGSYTGQLTSLQRYLEPINFMPRFSGIPINISPA